MASRPPGIDGRLTDYGDPGFSSFLRRAFLASAGYDEGDVDRPVVAIVDTSSDYTTCHRDMPALAAAVRRGVLQGGALPLTLPTLSLGEILISPTAMLYRNLLAMETEEALTAYPMDAAVLLGGCDKTVPAQLMAAASADVPVVSVVTGPMRTGYWRGTRLGACTDCRAHWLQYRAGELDNSEIREVQQELCPTGGTCMVMGTASTMACLTEALGLMLPGGAAAPSGSGARLRHGAAPPGGGPPRPPGPPCRGRWGGGCRAAPPRRPAPAPACATRWPPAAAQPPWRAIRFARDRCSPRRQSPTRLPSCWRSEAPPTPLSTCWQSPAAPACHSP